MLINAINNGWINEKAILETLVCFKRAGCNGVLTYFAPVVAKMINEDL